MQGTLYRREEGGGGEWKDRAWPPSGSVAAAKQARSAPNDLCLDNRHSNLASVAKQQEE